MNDMLEKLYVAIHQHCEIEDDSIIDAANYGASGGFNGFIYYTDTVEFFDNNEDLIVEYAQQIAEEVGYKSWLEMADNFKTDTSDMTRLKNAMSWFALEEVGRWLQEQQTNLEFDVEHGRADEISTLYFRYLYAYNEYWEDANKRMADIRTKLSDELTDKPLEYLMEPNDNEEELVDVVTNWLKEKNCKWEDYNEVDDIFEFAMNIYQDAIDIAITNKTRIPQETHQSSQSSEVSDIS